ncbi:MAG TPA: GNAT family N-acetyltransferase [Candidatus Sulfotelmatobacter sp.]|nr:GNAT family N-acetyltransferase [Candidatus Sulfotelmatobacter sp.]
MHPLDNVIWQALTTRQTHCAESSREARRFLREITLLSAFREPSDQGYDSLAELVGPGGTAVLFLAEPYRARPGWELIAGPPLLQMIFANGTSPPTAAVTRSVEDAAIVDLGQPDSPEMVELATLTKPGPFATRTHELGTYLGIRRRVGDKDKLVAMAGERLKVPGHTEVSAVCTHPDYTGRGLAAILMTEVMRRIIARGETPFLHVREDNLRAIHLYERLGFRKRLRSHLALLRRNQSGISS